jgi:hypothetical protein
MRIISQCIKYMVKRVSDSLDASIFSVESKGGMGIGIALLA